MTIAAALTFRWETPPATTVGRPVGARDRKPDPYVDIAAQLREHPGRWAAVAEFRPEGSPQNLVRAIRAGHTRSWAPAGAFEATRRNRGDKTVVYARYLQPQT